LKKEIDFIYYFDLDNRLRVSAFKEYKKIQEFIVQYEAFIQQKWRPIVRYDTSHGFIHKDTIHPDQRQDKFPLFFMTYEVAFTYAITDIKRFWQVYREKYEKEMKN